MRPAIFLVFLAACGGKPPLSTASIARANAAVSPDAAPAAQEQPADAAPAAQPDPVDAAPSGAVAASCDGWAGRHPWPVPSTGHQVDFLCDLPDRVITVVADDVDEGQVHGTARSIDRVHGKVTTASLLKQSEGCIGMMKCHYATARKRMKRIWVEADGRIYSSGQVGDTDDTMVSCRPHSLGAIAICVTKEHTAELDVARCNAPGATGPDVALVVDVFGAAPGQLDPNGVEQPTEALPAHLVAVPPDGRTWVYRGPGVELAFDAGEPGGGTLRLGDKAPEPCLGFALYRDHR